MSDYEALKMRLKSGEHNGNDIMQAWIALDKLIHLQSEVERLRGRVAMLTDYVKEEVADGHTYKDYQNILDTDQSMPWLLRKQAEAVDNIRKDLLSDLPLHHIAKQVDIRLGLRVDSLREKADELEKAGGTG